MTLQSFFTSVSPLHPQTWQQIGPLFRRVILPRQAHFIAADETAREVAFLESGVVRAYFTNAKGQEYNKQFFVGPSIIGAYTSLLTGKPNLIPQQALTDCVVWATDYQEITGRYDQCPDLERLARKIAEYYFLEKEKKEIDIVLLDATERYALFLKEFPGLYQEIPQYHVASYLGITPVQLSRIRHQLAAK
ncbi:MAG: Crp/Fnr family transcriptional regulator [Bacteroidetes bacterium]|nr:MAG: Crp/Fnr family transcriptional regulator [Bacteroidota bacterium]